MTWRRRRISALRDSVNYAAALVQEVKKAAASLAEFAERGQVVPELDDETIREFLVSPYRLICRVSDDAVLILALVHGAQGLWRILTETSAG